MFIVCSFPKNLQNLIAMVLLCHTDSSSSTMSLSSDFGYNIFVLDFSLEMNPFLKLPIDLMVLAVRYHLVRNHLLDLKG